MTAQGRLFELDDGASLSAAAHDLKAPLATIHYLASTLRDDEFTMPLSQQSDYLWRIELTAQRGIQLVESLAYAYNSTQTELNLEPVNVTHVCEEVVHDMLPLAQRLAQTMELCLPKGDALALAHHTVLRSVLTNLCDNALKHNPPESHVVVRVAKLSDVISVAVRDNGPRLSKKDYQRLKLRLGREVNPLSGRPGSSGLGLYISSQLADAMNGRLGMVRHQNQGLTTQLKLQPSYQLSLI